MMDVCSLLYIYSISLESCCKLSGNDLIIVCVCVCLCAISLRIRKLIIS